MPYALQSPRLFYERSGAGQPLLCITGFAISSAVFEPVLPLLGERLECITYDNRGAGRSQAPRRLTSLHELAADAARLLDALELDSAHVCGVSMGGMIAQELAIRFPERVRGLMLCATWAGGPRAVRPGPRHLMRLSREMSSALRRPGRPWLAPALFSDAFRRREPERVGQLLELFGRHLPAPHGAWGHWWATVYHDTFSRLGRVQAPTLVMHGELDALAPLANARLLSQAIPDAELVVMPGAGHAFALECPRHTCAAALAWLERREPIMAGQRRTDWSARNEATLRPFGLASGALRTGVSLAGLVGDQLSGRRSKLLAVPPPPLSRDGARLASQPTERPPEADRRASALPRRRRAG
jgi:pimeloyl-ACP methyl ester carboxylesterase